MNAEPVKFKSQFPNFKVHPYIKDWIGSDDAGVFRIELVVISAIIECNLVFRCEEEFDSYVGSAVQMLIPKYYQKEKITLLEFPQEQSSPPS